MFLRWVRIENLRSLEQLELSFDAGGKPRKWTLLLAENGTGKTTLLRAIALVTAGSDALAGLLGDIDSWVRNGAQRAKIEAQIATADGETRDIALTIERGDTLASLLSRNQDSIVLLDDALKHADRNYFVVGYGASRRLAMTTSTSGFSVRESSGLSRRTQAVATLFSNDATLYPLSAWIKQLDYQGKGLATVRNTLNRMLPPGTRFKGITRKTGEVLFSTPDGDVPLERLSDGYQNVVAWCGDLLRQITEAFPDRRDPFKARGLLLVDEIDLHLHPIWQRQLIDFVTNQLPNFQIVCTTHSPLTAQQVGPGELIVMRRLAPDQAPQLDPFEGDPRLLRIDQLIVSPIFGIETSLSRELEVARSAHRSGSSAGKTSRTLVDPAVEDSQLAPSIETSSLERQRIDLLKEIRDALSDTQSGEVHAVTETT
ncbi:putative ATPase [Deinococcus metalli]|uniref:ATP-binding protein n=1 Tax=Deinococcus metalli TaxID=1141878 RepID=A0A7W8NS50_9DEIO|nr:AAA family ATPase [Deinococcus metalli]MBB5378575.1 putative ATPase [Deinococcus metalli]GHF58732.1 ATP-binding protein [Deinococcus metalli]